MITRKSFFQSASTSLRICQRCYHKYSLAPRIPEPTPFVPDPPTFLSLIGRDLSKHASKFPSWQALFSMTSAQMQDAGIEPPRTRKYLLRWLEKFRRGQFGVGGDLQHVKDGEAEVRIVEVPALKKTREDSDYNPTSISLTPGMTRLIVNLPAGEAEPKQPTHRLKKVKGLKLMRGQQITGPYVEYRSGAYGTVGVLRAKEGMWEDRRGRKIDGGERRRAEVRWRRAVEEHRKNSA